MPQGQERDAFGPVARAVEGAQQSLVQQLVPLETRDQPGAELSHSL